MSNNPKKTPSISEKITQLNELNAWFESEEFELEAALDKFTEAEKLAESIEEDLAQLKNRVTVIKQKFTE